MREGLPPLPDPYDKRWQGGLGTFVPKMDRTVPLGTSAELDEVLVRRDKVSSVELARQGADPLAAARAYVAVQEAPSAEEMALAADGEETDPQGDQGRRIVKVRKGNAPDVKRRLAFEALEEEDRVSREVGEVIPAYVEKLMEQRELEMRTRGCFAEFAACVATQIGIRAGELDASTIAEKRQVARMKRDLYQRVGRLRERLRIEEADPSGRLGLERGNARLRGERLPMTGGIVMPVLCSEFVGGFVRRMEAPRGAGTSGEGPAELVWLRARQLRRLLLAVLRRVKLQH